MVSILYLFFLVCSLFSVYWEVLCCFSGFGLVCLLSLVLGVLVGLVSTLLVRDLSFVIALYRTIELFTASLSIGILTQTKMQMTLLLAYFSSGLFSFVFLTSSSLFPSSLF
jgi:hypothetical protein